VRNTRVAQSHQQIRQRLSDANDMSDNDDIDILDVVIDVSD
jgi:hypothetical protein